MARWSSKQLKQNSNPQLRGRQNRKTGETAQDLALLKLRVLGLKALDIEVNEWIPIRDKVKPEKVVGAFPGRKRKSDIRGIVPGTGRSVMIEVKSRPNSVSWSDLEDHQHEALDDHATHGGLSLIAWMRGDEMFLFEYPHQDFAPGSPLKKTSAQFKPYWTSQ